MKKVTIFNTILDFLKRNKEFTNKDVFRIVIQEGGTPLTAEKYLSLLKRSGMITVKIKRKELTIYESMIYKGDEENE